MESKEAAEIIEALAKVAIVDTVNLKERLGELRQDYAKDPWPDTNAQIKRLETRLAKRVREAQALAIAVTKFEDNRPTA